MFLSIRFICCVAILLLPIQAKAFASEVDVEFYRVPGSKMPFSPAVRVGNVIYLSGQIGFSKDGTLSKDIKVQAKAVMDNIATTVARAGATMDDIFKCTVMIDDISRWAEFNEVYVTYFKAERLPARSAFGADGLGFGAAFEVECMAYLANEEK